MDDEMDDVQPWEDDAYETTMPKNDASEEDHEPSDDMDGDHGSALASVGWGTDEDYFFEPDGEW